MELAGAAGATLGKEWDSIRSDICFYSKIRFEKKYIYSYNLYHYTRKKDKF